MVQAVPAGRSEGSTRTCIGCRGRGERSHLLRVVLAEASGVPVLVLDESRSMPGRGAWLHARVECVDQAVRRKAFGRALRVGVALDASDVRAEVARRASLQEQHDSGAVTEAASSLENRKRV